MKDIRRNINETLTSVIYTLLTSSVIRLWTHNTHRTHQQFTLSDMLKDGHEIIHWPVYDRSPMMFSFWQVLQFLLINDLSWASKPDSYHSPYC